MGWPKRVSSWAMARVDLLVHLSRLIGSPAVVSSRMRVRCCPIAGATCSAFFRPPPGWRTLPVAAVFNRFLPRNSLTPLVIVTRDMPVSRASRLTPPRPNSIARSATNNRAWYSLRVPRTRNQRNSVGEGDVPARPWTCMFPRYPKSIELYRLFLSRPIVERQGGIGDVVDDEPVHRRDRLADRIDQGAGQLLQELEEPAGGRDRRDQDPQAHR